MSVLRLCARILTLHVYTRRSTSVTTYLFINSSLNCIRDFLRVYIVHVDLTAFSDFSSLGVSFPFIPSPLWDTVQVSIWWAVVLAREAPQDRNTTMFQTKLAMGICLYMCYAYSILNQYVMGNMLLCNGARDINLHSSESDVLGYTDRYARD